MGIGFEILAHTPVPQLPPSYPTPTSPRFEPVLSKSRSYLQEKLCSFYIRQKKLDYLCMTKYLSNELVSYIGFYLGCAFINQHDTKNVGQNQKHNGCRRKIMLLLEILSDHN